MRVRYHAVLLLVLVSLIAGFATSSQSQGQPTPVRREANDLLLQLNLAVKMAVIGANGELFIQGSAGFTLTHRKEQTQEILNYLVGRKSPDYLDAANPALATPKNWDGTGMLERSDRLNAELENAINRGEIPQPSARLLRAAVLEIALLIRKAIGLTKEALTQDNERPMKEKLVEVKVALIAARGSREDPLLEGGVRSVMGNLPNR